MSSSPYDQFRLENNCNQEVLTFWRGMTILVGCIALAFIVGLVLLCSVMHSRIALKEAEFQKAKSARYAIAQQRELEIDYVPHQNLEDLFMSWLEGDLFVPEHGTLPLFANNRLQY